MTISQSEMFPHLYDLIQIMNLTQSDHWAEDENFRDESIGPYMPRFKLIVGAQLKQQSNIWQNFWLKIC